MIGGENFRFEFTVLSTHPLQWDYTLSFSLVEKIERILALQTAKILRNQMITPADTSENSLHALQQIILLILLSLNDIKEPP